MDGVLCDFVKGAEKLTGKKIDVWAKAVSQKNGVKLNQRKIFGLHYLESGGKQLWNFLKKLRYRNFISVCRRYIR